jgi:hypothetical protein
MEPRWKSRVTGERDNQFGIEVVFGLNYASQRKGARRHLQEICARDLWTLTSILLNTVLRGGPLTPNAQPPAGFNRRASFERLSDHDSDESVMTLSDHHSDDGQNCGGVCGETVGGGPPW